MASPERTTLTNVRVFDGHKLTSPSNITISNGKVESISATAHTGSTSDEKDATIIDGAGHALLPGLIDAHCHIFSNEQLHQMAKAGITTTLDMTSFPVSNVHALKSLEGTTDFYSAGIPLTAPGSNHSKIEGMPKEAAAETAEGARKFVRDRVEEGMDYIKLIVDAPPAIAPSQEVLNAACNEARRTEKLTIAHALTFEAVKMAQEAGVDFVTHVMLDQPIDREGVERMKKEGRGLIPTLTIMKKVHDLGIQGFDYANGRASVKACHEAGIKILAGTDANVIPGSPAHVQHGESLWRELELLVDAGLTPVEALRAATCETALAFGFKDRGAIEVGMKADLMLVEGDPTKGISEIRSVHHVWCGGVEITN